MSGGERQHKNIWRLFKRLIEGGYPDNEATMKLARRSILRRTTSKNGTPNQ